MPNFIPIFSFMDETGHLRRDPHFLIGLVKIQRPGLFNDKLRRLRDKHKFYDEIKFEKMSNLRVKFYKEVINLFTRYENISYHAVIRKRKPLFKKPWRIYNQMAVELIKDCIGGNEILCVWADDIVTPKEDDYEVFIKETINNYFKRLALFGICRIESRPVDLIQVADLIGGSIVCNLNLKSKAKIKYSARKRNFAKLINKLLPKTKITVTTLA